MQVKHGSHQIPFIFTAHHASHEFHDFTERVALNEEQRIRFSDYGTALTVPSVGVASIVATQSRALGDLNRDPDDPMRFAELDYGKPDRHPIWRSGEALTNDEKIICQKRFYEPFHSKIIQLLKQQSQETVVVAWDNTAHYEIGTNEAGQAITMPNIVLSNRGDEGAANGTHDSVSCDPDLLYFVAEAMQANLRASGLPHEVDLNLVYKGGYICRTYSSYRNSDLLQSLGVVVPVQSFQVEYNTNLTHDQQTLEAHTAHIRMLKAALSNALISAWSRYQR